MSAGCQITPVQANTGPAALPRFANASSQIVPQRPAHDPTRLSIPGNAPSRFQLPAETLTTSTVTADASPDHSDRQSHLPLPNDAPFNTPQATSEAIVQFSERYSEQRSARPLNSAQHEAISQLCDFFKQNLLVHIPVLTLHDIGEPASMIRGDRWLLAFSTAYVAAKFIPGCREIQEMLVDPIHDGFRICSQAREDSKRWTALQALAVLYNWTNSEDHHSGPKRVDVSDFDSEMLRMLWYDMARRSLLHESAESVARLWQQRGHVNIHIDVPCRKYLQWLWMFATTHFRALLTRRVPIIKPDLSIYSSTHLLRDSREDDHVRLILSQVELALIWFRPALLESGLWDWSLSEATTLNVDDLPALLKDLEEALDCWAIEWCPNGRIQYPTDIMALIHYNFAAFCVSVHSINLLATLKTAQKVEIRSLNPLAHSVERCYNLWTSVLGLHPLDKYSVAFTPESGFNMILHTRDYVIGVHQSRKHSHIVKAHHLNALHDLSKFMQEGGISDTRDSQHRIIT